MYNQFYLKKYIYVYIKIKSIKKYIGLEERILVLLAGNYIYNIFVKKDQNLNLKKRF